MDQSQTKKQFKELINHIISMNCDVDRKGVEACLKKSEPKGLDDIGDQRLTWDSLCKDALDQRYFLTPNDAKKIVKGALWNHDIPHTKLTAKTVHFTDLARESRIFVTIHGAPMTERLQDVEKLAKSRGFSIQYK